MGSIGLSDVEIQVIIKEFSGEYYSLPNPPTPSILPPIHTHIQEPSYIVGYVSSDVLSEE